ncbi:MAG: pur operon repressor [Bacillota bacterium]|jgi:purine operon repressor
MGNKLHKGERAAIITRLLCEQPNQLLSLTDLSNRLGVAKSTVSEDVAAIKEALTAAELGRVQTVSGASGGVKWIPGGGEAWQKQVIAELCRQLSDSRRILPGGYLYTTDLCTDARQVEQYAQMFAHYFAQRQPNVVLTVETRGIPLAYATARYLGVPLAVARKELPMPVESLLIRQERSEGPTMNINYVSGSRQRVQTMALPRRSLPQAARALIIDDFMRAGGTARGLEQLMSEFGATTVGCGVLVTTARPEQKLVDEFLALACLEEVDEVNQRVSVSPGQWCK